MPKKQSGVPAKRLADSQLKAFRRKLDQWISKNNFWEETFFRTAEEYYGPKHKEFPYPHYFVLIAEGDLHDVLWAYPSLASETVDRSKLRREFDAILKQHGLWMEPEDNVTFTIMSRDTSDRT